MQTNEPINLNVGGVIFKTTKQTVFIHESYLKSLVKNHNFEERGSIIYVDRDSLCFPIILNYLRGYSLKKSQISNIWKKSGLSKREFYVSLHEDVYFYGIESLIQEYEKFLYEEYPEMLDEKCIEEIEVKNNPDHDVEKKILVEKIQQRIAIARDSISLTDKIVEKFQEYEKLTVNCPRKQLLNAYNDVCYYMKFDEFKARFCSMTLLFLVAITEAVFHHTSIDLRKTAHDVVRDLRNREEILEFLFPYWGEIDVSPVGTFTIGAMAKFIFQYMNTKNTENNKTLEKYNNVNIGEDNITLDINDI